MGDRGGRGVLLGFLQHPGRRREYRPDLSRRRLQLQSLPLADLLQRRYPGALPFIFTGFQLGLGMALIVVVIAENFGTQVGVGFLIWRSWQIFEVRDMYV